MPAERRRGRRSGTHGRLASAALRPRAKQERLKPWIQGRMPAEPWAYAPERRRGRRSGTHGSLAYAALRPRAKQERLKPWNQGRMPAEPWAYALGAKGICPRSVVAGGEVVPMEA